MLNHPFAAQVRDAVLFRVARLEAGEDAGDAARGALEAVARDASAGDLEAQFAAHGLRHVLGFHPRDLQGALPRRKQPVLTKLQNSL